MKKLSKAIVLASAMTAGLAAVNTAQAADVEVSASAGVSNMYLWRGLDLGYGAAMVESEKNQTLTQIKNRTQRQDKNEKTKGSQQN